MPISSTSRYAIIAPTMYWLLSNINFWGATSGLIGAVMLFFFGLPPRLNKDGHINLILEQTDSPEAKKHKLFQILSYVALGLICLSFLLQIINIVAFPLPATNAPGRKQTTQSTALLTQKTGMNTNLLIFQLIGNNYILVLMIILLLLPIIPSEALGYWKYNHNNPNEGRAKKMTLLRFILHFIIDSIFAEILVDGTATFQTKLTATFIIFLITFYNIFFQHQISNGAITLVSIGIIILYLERLIEFGKHIKLFWGLIEWQKQELIQPTFSLPVTPPQTIPQVTNTTPNSVSTPTTPLLSQTNQS